MKKIFSGLLVLALLMTFSVSSLAYEIPNDFKINNLDRTNWVATAQGGSTGTYTPDRVLDGKYDNGIGGNVDYCFKISDAKVGDYLQLDMNSPRIIDKATFYTSKWTPINRFKVFVSNEPIVDTANMTPVAQLEGCAGNYDVAVNGDPEGRKYQIIRFAPVSAQYIRFEVYENTGWINIDEVNIGTPWAMPENSVAIGKGDFVIDAIGSQPFGVGGLPKVLIDGKIGGANAWACAKSTAEPSRRKGDWITVDMGLPTTTTGVALITNDVPDYKYARSFNVYLSDDTTYTADEIVKTVTNGAEGATVASWTPTTKRYMKIEIKDDDTDWWNLDELEFYGPETNTKNIPKLSKTGWVANAVSLYVDGSGLREITNLVDNDKNSLWAVEAGGRTKGNWVSVDMQKEKTISGISLYTEIEDNKFVKDFKVYTSLTPFTDGKNETTEAINLLNGNTQVAESTNARGGYQFVEFATPTKARYIKIVANEDQYAVGNDWWNLNEIDVYGDATIKDCINFSYDNLTMPQFEQQFKAGNIFNYAGFEKTPVSVDIGAYALKDENAIAVVATYKNNALGSIELLNRNGNICSGSIAISEKDTAIKVFILNDFSTMNPLSEAYVLSK